jgi:hypothetical protein
VTLPPFPPLRKTASGWRCSDARCRERLAKADGESPDGLVLTGSPYLLVKAGRMVVACRKCKRVHDVGGLVGRFFLAVGGE